MFVTPVSIPLFCPRGTRYVRVEGSIATLYNPARVMVRRYFVILHGACSFYAVRSARGVSSESYLDYTFNLTRSRLDLPRLWHSVFEYFPRAFLSNETIPWHGNSPSIFLSEIFSITPATVANARTGQGQPINILNFSTGRSRRARPRSVP